MGRHWRNLLAVKRQTQPSSWSWHRCKTAASSAKKRSSKLTAKGKTCSSQFCSSVTCWIFVGGPQEKRKRKKETVNTKKILLGRRWWRRLLKVFPLSSRGWLVTIQKGHSRAIFNLSRATCYFPPSSKKQGQTLLSWGGHWLCKSLRKKSHHFCKKNERRRNQQQTIEQNKNYRPPASMLWRHGACTAAIRTRSTRNNRWTATKTFPAVTTDSILECRSWWPDLWLQLDTLPDTHPHTTAIRWR